MACTPAAPTAPDDTFFKADSRNLPSVEMVMVLEYMAVNNSHNIAEIRGAKALMTSRDSYVETAVGFVEIKRVSGVCFVRAKVVPEHRLSNKLYNVSAKINEGDDIITEALCEDCAAAAGGCKHSLLLLFWLIKRSSEASPTSVQCYWTRPKLSSARTELVQTKAIFRHSKKIRLCPKQPEVVPNFLEECERRSLKGSLIGCLNQKNINNIIVFDMALDFIEEVPLHTFENFLEFANTKICPDLIQQVNDKTKEQSNNTFWHNIRQGRITASRLYEAAHCMTDGALVQQILGGYKVPETAAMKRGKKLEEAVVKEIEKKLSVKIIKSGFILINSILGASPDGVTQDFVVEVKCPSTKKSFKTYVKDKTLNKKFEAQIQCQMLAANKRKGLFCVASPSFESDKKIHLYWVNYKKDMLRDLIGKATNFWKCFVYPKIISSAKE